MINPTTLADAVTARGLAAQIATEPTGFAGVPFRVRVVDGWADWASAANVVTRRIPGSDRSVTQMMGLGPQTVTYQLMLPSVAAYRQLSTLIGTTGRLTVVEDAAAPEGDVHLEAGTSYLAIDDVLLAGIEPNSVERYGPMVWCRATFQRDRP